MKKRINNKHSMSNQSNGSRSIFARIMSTENIQVVFNPNEQAAWFDTKTRVLSMPNWNGMTPEVYDLLLSHEVSHALHTPSLDWINLTDELVGKDASESDKKVARDYMNIVEDARIERLIKSKYPGLARDYMKGYEWLMEQGFMGKLNDTNALADLSLIDRVNIYFKAGKHCGVQVPFNADEQNIVDMIENSQSFDDVTKITRLIWDYDCENPAKKNNTKTNGGSNGNVKNGNGNNNPSGNDDDGDQTNGSGNNQGRNHIAPESPETVKSMEKFLNTRRDAHTHDAPAQLPLYNLDQIVVPSNTIYKYLSESQDSCTRCNNVMADLKNEFVKFVSEANATVDNMVKVFLTKKAAREHHRQQEAKTGTLDMNKLSTYKWNDDLFKHFTVLPKGKNHGFILFLDWSGSMGGMIQDVVKQMYILTSFFRRVNVPFDVYAFSSNVPATCSNADYMEYTRNISSQIEDAGGEKVWSKAHQSNYGEIGVMGSRRFWLYQFASSGMKKNEYLNAMERLYILADSVSSNGWSYRSSNHSYPVPYPTWLGLGDTPLDDSLVAANQLIENFKIKHGIEIMNAVFITDGSSNGGPTDYGVAISINNDPSNNHSRNYGNSEWISEGKVHTKPTRLINKKNGASYIIGDRLSTNVLANYLTENTGANTMMIFLSDCNQGTNVGIPGHVVSLPNGDVYSYRGKTEDYTKFNEHWTSENFLLAVPQDIDNHTWSPVDPAKSKPSFSTVFAVRIPRKATEDVFQTLDMDNTTYTRLKSQFVKSLQKRIISRGLVNRMVEAMAKHT